MRAGPSARLSWAGGQGRSRARRAPAPGPRRARVRAGSRGDAGHAARGGAGGARRRAPRRRPLRAAGPRRCSAGSGERSVSTPAPCPTRTTPAHDPVHYPGDDSGDDFGFPLEFDLVVQADPDPDCPEVDIARLQAEIRSSRRVQAGARALPRVPPGAALVCLRALEPAPLQPGDSGGTWAARFPALVGSAASVECSSVWPDRFPHCRA